MTVLEELVAKLGLEVDGQSFVVAEKLMEVARGGMLAIGAAAAAAGVALATAVSKTASYADGIEKAAQRTGIGVEALQALQYAAERADVGAEGLQAALNFMAKRGVTDFEAELRRAADELAAMPDGGAKAARAMQLFGKQGAALIPMLNQGAAGLDEMTSFAREAGIVLGEDMIESGASLKDALEELQGFIRGLAFTIAGPLLKPVREWLKAAGAWIGANRAIISQHFERAITLVGRALGIAFRLAEPVVDIMLRLEAAIADSKVAMVALGAAAAWLAAPFLAPAAAIGLLLMALEEVWGWVTGKRSTLLEDELGSFEDFKKSMDVINPEDNGFVVAAKLTAQFFEAAYGFALKLKAAALEVRDGLGLGPTGFSKQRPAQGLGERSGAAAMGAVSTANFVGYGLLAPFFDFAAKQRDIAWSQMGFYGEQAFLDPTVARQMLPPSMQTGPSVNVGQVVVNVPGGDAEAIAREVRGELDRQFRAAQPAVVGP